MGELDPGKQQKILDQLEASDLPILGLTFGNPDWVLEEKKEDVRQRISQALDSLLELKLGKNTRIVVFIDVEPHAKGIGPDGKSWREVTGWNGDLNSYSTLLQDVIVPLMKEYAGRFETRFGRPVFYDVPLALFEPHWWTNGHQTEDGFIIRNLTYPTGMRIALAGMTYQPDSRRILNVSERVWKRALETENVSFMVGLDTNPPTSGSPHSFDGREEQIPSVFLEIYQGIPEEARGRFLGFFPHIGKGTSGVPAPERADRIYKKMLGTSSNLKEAGKALQSGLEGAVIEGVSVPAAGVLLNWYSHLPIEGELIPTSLLEVLDPERNRLLLPTAEIASQTALLIQWGALTESVMQALRAAGLKVESFDLENVPKPAPDFETEFVYLMDVPLGSEREWVSNPSAVVINFRPAKLDGRPQTVGELGALINVAREADKRVFQAGQIHRSTDPGLRNQIIAIDTQA